MHLLEERTSYSEVDSLTGTMSCSLERVCTVGPNQTTFGSTRFITIHRLKDAHIKIFVVRNIMFGYLFPKIQSLYIDKQ